MISELDESRSVKEASIPQCMASVAGHPKNRLYIDSGAFIQILFNKVLMGGLVNLNRPFKIQAGGKLIYIFQIRSLHQALRHLLLPVSTYYYSKTTIANLLLFAKLANKYYIICNTRVDDRVYVQSKDDGKYLPFQRDHKFNLYYIDISKADLEEHCYLNTEKKRKTLFSILDQEIAEVVMILQEQYGFSSDKDSINALECDFIDGVVLDRRDVNIAINIYGYSKGTAMGRFKHPLKGVKMDRTVGIQTAALLVTL